MASEPKNKAKEPLAAGECDSATGARLLMCSVQWFGKLVREGWITALGRNRYRVIDVVQGHIKFMKDENRRATITKSTSRVQDARASQIELAVAREQREVIEVEEVEAFLSETIGTLRTELTGVAAASTRDLAVRSEIEKNLNAAIERCRAAFDQATKALGERRPIAVDAEEADAG